ncbi:MAG TPA: methyltransferase domain-containing protein [Candidatus Omnitrophota bacterium]|nr:methyltransferase domain-containing protein [Candidatus Omnitrophota bacterium]HPS19540.1 methyltransferase domain-containing protein [Candidatus Omnitrophota bacterium]
MNNRPEILDMVVPNAGKVLDVGCAEGDVGSALKKRTNCEVIGIELDPGKGEIAKKKIDRVIIGDVEKLVIDFPEKWFDCIIFADVLEHLRDPLSVITKYGKHLKDRGKMIVCISNVRHISIIADLLFWGRWECKEYGLMDSGHIRFFTRKSILRIFQNAGFRVISSKKILSLKGSGMLSKLTFGIFDEFLTAKYVFEIAKMESVFKGYKKVDSITREAWGENWRDISIDRVMEIFDYTRVKRLLETIRAELPEKGKILEGGCGLGPWLIKLRSLGYDIEGVDYDESSVGKIRAFDSSISVSVANIEQMPFPDRYFSVYLSFGVLEHFYEGPEKAVREAWRVLEDGGKFIIFLPHMNFLLAVRFPFEKMKKNVFIRRILGKKEKNFYYEKYFNRREISGILRKNGFDIENIRPVDHIFSFVQFSAIFRDKNTYDGENRIAVKISDSLKGLFPWGTAGSMMIIAKKRYKRGAEHETCNTNTLS